MLLGEDVLRDGERGHCLGSTDVEREVSDRFDDRGLGEPVLFAEVQVVWQLTGVAAGGEGGDRHEAAVRGNL